MLHWTLVFLVIALIAGVLALTRRAERAAPFVTIAATLLAGVAALLNRPVPGGAVPAQVTAEWLRIGERFTIALNVKLDALGWVMVGVVCFVSLLVQIYSMGYMRGDFTDAKAYDDLTSACNACHQATNHGVVVIRAPTDASLSDQDFVRQGP